MTSARDKLYLAFGLSICLFLASGSVVSDDGEFTFPILKSQPVVIQSVVSTVDNDKGTEGLNFDQLHELVIF